jgi:hypothetical protein
MTDSTAPAPQQPRRCRSLTVRGRQCLAGAVHGSQYCIAHTKYRFPVCPQGKKIAVPLLEDLDTIQVVATQVAHGLFTETLDPWRAGKILYALQVAALTIARPAPLKPSEEKPVINEPVSQAEPDLDGHFLGPDVPWKGNDAAFNPVWSYDRLRYVRECERLGKPIPTTPEEFPAEGWLTKDETRERESGIAVSDDFLDRTLQMRLQEDRIGKLPPLYKRKCSYGDDRCKGPWDMGRHHDPCKWCRQEREERIRIHPEEDVEVISYASELGTSDDQFGLQPRIRTDLPRLSVTTRAHRVPLGPPLASVRTAEPARPAEPGAITDLNASASIPGAGVPYPANHRSRRAWPERSRAAAGSNGAGGSRSSVPHRGTAPLMSNSTTPPTLSFQSPAPGHTTQGGGVRPGKAALARRAAALEDSKDPGSLLHAR